MHSASVGGGGLEDLGRYDCACERHRVTRYTYSLAAILQ